MSGCVNIGRLVNPPGSAGVRASAGPAAGWVARPRLSQNGPSRPLDLNLQVGFRTRRISFHQIYLCMISRSAFANLASNRHLIASNRHLIKLESADAVDITSVIIIINFAISESALPFVHLTPNRLSVMRFDSDRRLLCERILL